MRHWYRFAKAVLLAALAGCGELPPIEAEAAEEALTGAPLGSCVPPLAFTHVAGPANIVEHYTLIDHPAAKDPSAILIVTPNWTPNGGPEVRNYHPVGVYFDGARGRWAIYNEDGTPMPPGTGFNVRVGPGFVVRSPIGAGPVNAFTMSTQPASTARLLITPSYNPGGAATGSNNWSPLAAGYVSAFGLTRWVLAHTDVVPFDANVAYNLADEPCATTLRVPSTVSPGVEVSLGDAVSRGNPAAVVIAARRLAALTGEPSQPGHLAVRYDAGLGRWLLRGWNNSGEGMPAGTLLELLVERP